MSQYGVTRPQWVNCKSNHHTIHLGSTLVLCTNYYLVFSHMPIQPLLRSRCWSRRACNKEQLLYVLAWHEWRTIALLQSHAKTGSLAPSKYTGVPWKTTAYKERVLLSMFWWDHSKDPVLVTRLWLRGCEICIVCVLGACAINNRAVTNEYRARRSIREHILRQTTNDCAFSWHRVVGIWLWPTSMSLLEMDWRELPARLPSCTTPGWRWIHPNLEGIRQWCKTTPMPLGTHTHT